MLKVQPAGVKLAAAVALPILVVHVQMPAAVRSSLITFPWISVLPVAVHNTCVTPVVANFAVMAQRDVLTMRSVAVPVVLE